MIKPEEGECYRYRSHKRMGYGNCENGDLLRYLGIDDGTPQFYNIDTGEIVAIINSKFLKER